MKRKKNYKEEETFKIPRFPSVKSLGKILEPSISKVSVLFLMLQIFGEEELELVVVKLNEV